MGGREQDEILIVVVENRFVEVEPLNIEKVSDDPAKINLCIIQDCPQEVDN